LFDQIPATSPDSSPLLTPLTHRMFCSEDDKFINGAPYVYERKRKRKRKGGEEGEDSTGVPSGNGRGNASRLQSGRSARGGNPLLKYLGDDYTRGRTTDH